MNSFVAVLFLAAAVSAGWSGHDGHSWNAAAHIPSGSVSVGHNGVVVAGPAGSVHTDNGLHGHGAGARLSGPAGEVATHGGHAHLAGPGVGHGHGHVAVVAPVVGAWGHGGGWGNGAWGNGAWGNGAWGNGAWGHGGVVVAHGLVGHGHHGW